MPITPYLYYEDVGSALRFLVKAFGFRRYGVQMRGPDGTISHAAMQLGAGLIMKATSGHSLRPFRGGEANESGGEPAVSGLCS